MDNAYPPVVSKTKLKKLIEDGWELPDGDAKKACSDEFMILRRKSGTTYSFMIICRGLRGPMNLNANGSISY